MLGNAPIRIEHPRAASGTVGALGLTNTSGLSIRKSVARHTENSLQADRLAR